jgi:hypothetical protein
VRLPIPTAAPVAAAARPRADVDAELHEYLASRSRCALLSTCIYGGDVQAWTTPDIAAGRFVDAKLNLRGGAEIRDGHAFIAFRGTVGPFLFARNWLRVNLKSGWTADDPPVHAGFQRAWRALKPQVLQWLALHRPASVCLTGHSMGAAMAQLAALDLADEWPVMRVVLFATPMVGGAAFNDRYASSKLDRCTQHYLLLTDAISLPLPRLRGYLPPRHVARIDRRGFAASENAGMPLQAWRLLAEPGRPEFPAGTCDPFLRPDPLLSAEESLMSAMKWWVIPGGSVHAFVGAVGLAMLSVLRRAVAYHGMAGYATALGQGLLFHGGRVPAWEGRVSLVALEAMRPRGGEAHAAEQDETPPAPPSAH